MSRLIAIGDIHGCVAALKNVLEAIAPRAEDTIVTLGDYVDRGPHSSNVLEMLLALAKQCRLVPLLGNHDEMMVKVCRGREDLLLDWLVYGGRETLASYHTTAPGDVWPRHLEFLASCPLFYETDRYFFVHGNYDSELPLSEQPRDLLLWTSLKRRVPGRHSSGKTAILGHTSQKTGEVLDLGHLKCIDTWCYGDGWLTAMELTSGRVWQAAKDGRMRDER
jgi:serine/threonine protein phosphatase 1